MARMLVGRSSAVASAKWSRKPGPISVPKAVSPELDRALDEVDRGDSILAVRTHVVADDEGAVGPADEHRPVETELVDYRRDVVGPEPVVGVVLRLQRRLGHAVAAEVVRDEPELVGKRALVLLGPAEVVLRPAVDEEDRRPVRVAPLAHVQPQAAASLDRVDPRSLLRLRQSPSSLASSRSWDRRDRGAGAAAAHRAAGLIFRRRHTYLRAEALTSALPGRVAAGYLPDGGPRERGVRRARTRARGARARARCGAGGKRRDRARRRGSGDRQDPAGVRARATCPRRRVRGPARALDRPRRHGAAVPAVRRGAASARRASAARRAGGLAAARVRGHARAARPIAPPSRPCCSCSRICTGPTRRRSTSSSSSRTTSTTGRFCCSRPTARTSPRRPSACAGSPTASGAPARRWCSSSVRSSARSWRRLLAAHADAPLPAALTDAIVARSEGNPFFAEELVAAAARRERRAPASACATCCCSAWPASTDRRRACCGWRPPPDATSGTRCCTRRRRCRSATCASRSAVPSSTAFSSPTRRTAASASATRSSPRRSTRRSCPASARSCTRASPRSSRAAELRRRRSSRRTGRRQVARRGARRVDRGGAPGGGRVRPGRGARAPRAGARAVGARAGRSPARRARPRRALLLDRRARQPDGRRAARGRARAAGDRARRATAIRLRAGLLHERLGGYLFETAATTPASPRSSAPSRSCRRSRPRRSARRCWPRSRAV